MDTGFWISTLCSLSDLFKTLSKAPCLARLTRPRRGSAHTRQMKKKLAWEAACLVIPFDGSGKAVFTNTMVAMSAGERESKERDGEKSNET